MWTRIDYDGSTPYIEDEQKERRNACYKEGHEEMKKIHLTKTSAGVGS